jgi:hypothetical protein
MRQGFRPAPGALAHRAGAAGGLVTAGITGIGVFAAVLMSASGQYPALPAPAPHQPPVIAGRDPMTLGMVVVRRKANNLPMARVDDR